MPHLVGWPDGRPDAASDRLARRSTRRRICSAGWTIDQTPHLLGALDTDHGFFKSAMYKTELSQAI
jgi:hypothetical protein